MQETKQEYLQNVLETYRMSHIEKLLNKYKEKRDEIKEVLEKKYNSNIYNPINSGSFAKHTAINVKFDLDIAVPFKRDSFATLEEMFNDVIRFLSEKYKNETIIRRQKVSIGLEFFPDNDGDTISIDVVPGRELNKDQYTDDKNMKLFVSSGYGLIDEKSYIQTNIQAQIDHIKAKENERKIIRLLKIWKTTNSENYKSFLLELITINAFDKERIESNLWEKLKSVMTYIKDNIAKDGFSLIDPGNSNNNVIETLESWERQNLADKIKIIINNIELNDDNIKLYFPKNSKFDANVDSSKRGGYGIKGATIGASIPPNNQRFGNS